MKKLFAAILCLAFGAFLAFAASAVTINAEPAVQKVMYDDGIYVDRFCNGVAMGANYQFTLKDSSSIGAELSLGIFPYDGFYSYMDIRLSAAMRWAIVRKDYSEDFGMGVFGAFNVGASLDLRDDSDVGVYPFFQLGPVFMVLMDRISTEIDFNVSVSFQDGSTVTQLSPRVGVSIPLGGYSK